jgi:hypothetical protein
MSGNCFFTNKIKLADCEVLQVCHEKDICSVLEGVDDPIADSSAAFTRVSRLNLMKLESKRRDD